MELLEAASRGQLEVLEKLLSESEHTDDLDEDDVVNFQIGGWTCLHFASLSGQDEVIRYLASQDADCNSVSLEGWTPLQLAAFHGHDKAVEALLAHPDIQINKQNHLRSSALHQAAFAGHPKVVKQLLDAGACVTMADSQGRLPIELTDNQEILELIPVYLGQDFLGRYISLPESYGSQLFYRNNFFLNDKYVFLYLNLQTNHLSRYNSEIEFRQDKRPNRQMSLDEIQEVKTEPRGFFDKAHIFFFSVKTRTLKRVYYTNDETQTLNWVTRIKQALEFVQTSPSQTKVNMTKRGSTTSTIISLGNESDIVENDLVIEQRGSEVQQEAVGLNSFAIIKELGAGSFGKVYKAFKKNSGEVLALKSLSKRSLERKKQLKYAINEARVLKHLNHPNIVQLRYCFQTKRNLYLALEYCANGDLGMHLYKGKMFDEPRARFYLAQTMLALEYLHNRDIVYRDLKPDNLLLDAVGNIKLTDFGLVREHIPNFQGVIASFCGSPAYLPPEMVRDQISGKAGDIYSLGVVLYEMLSGTTPFRTSNIDSLFTSILKDKLTFPSHFSKSARDFISKAMQKDPAKRGCIQTMLNHPFMRAIDWEKLERGQLEPPRLGPSWTQFDSIEDYAEAIDVQSALTVDIDELDETNIIKEFTQ